MTFSVLNNWKGLLLFLLVVVAAASLQAQSAFTPLDNQSYHLIDRWEIKSGSFRDQLHTQSKPYLRKEIVAYNRYADSLIEEKSRSDAFNLQYLYNDNSEWARSESESSRKPIFKHFYREPAFLYQVDVPAFNLRVNPVLHFQVGYEEGIDDLKFLNTRGLELRGTIDEKVAFYFFATDNQGYFQEHVHDRIDDRFQVMPGEGRAKSFKENGVDFFSARGYIDFNVTRHINVQFGQDKNFIGNGFRSLFLSDYGKDYLFLKFKTQVWRIHYQNIFAELANYRQENISDSPIQKKYAATHHLSVNISPNFNLGLFETVVFGRTDSLGNTTGFEFQYLNPIIFYRSIEFNLGSIDNVLIGLDWKYNFLRRFSFYGQVFIDEFNFGELRARDGWWANKFGLQAGLKYIDVAGVSNLDLQLEYNLVRPYMYTHFNEQSSYTHFSQPLAHPLGANFSEFIAIARYQPIPRLNMVMKLIAATYGLDSAGTNFGQDIFLDNSTREMDYGNEIGQGFATDLLIADLAVSYQLFHNVFGDLNLIYRNSNSELASADRRTYYLSAGVRVNIGARQFDF